MAINYFSRRPSDEEIESIRQKGYEYLPDEGEFGGARKIEAVPEPEPVVKEPVVQEDVSVEAPAEPEPAPEPEPQPQEQAPQPQTFQLSRIPTAEEQNDMLSKGYSYDKRTNVATRLEPIKLSRTPSKAEINKMAAKGYSYSEKDNVAYKIGQGKIPVVKDSRLDKESAKKLIWLADQKYGDVFGDAITEEFAASVVGAARSMPARITAGFKGALGLPTVAEDVEIEEETRKAYEPLRMRQSRPFGIMNADEDFWARRERVNWMDKEVTKKSLAEAAQKFRQSHERKTGEVEKILADYAGMNRLAQTAASVTGRGAFLGLPEDVAEETGATSLMQEANADLAMAQYLESVVDSQLDLPESSDFDIETLRTRIGKRLAPMGRDAAARIATEAQDHVRNNFGDPADREWADISDALFSVDTVNNAVGAVVDGLVFLPLVTKNVLVDPLMASARYGYDYVTDAEKEELNESMRKWEDESYEIAEGTAFALQGLAHLVGEGAGGVKTLATGTPEQKEETLKRMVYGAHKYAGDVMTAAGGVAGVGKARVASRLAKVNKELGEKVGVLEEFVTAGQSLDDAPQTVVTPTAEGVKSRIKVDDVPFGSYNRLQRAADTPAGKVIVPNMELLPFESAQQIQGLVDDVAALSLRREFLKKAYDRLDTFEGIADPTYAVMRMYGALPGFASRIANELGAQFDGGRAMDLLFTRQSELTQRVEVDNVLNQRFHDLEGGSISVADLLDQRRRGLLEDLIRYRDTAERVPDELLSEVEDLVAEFAAQEGKQLWIETPSGEMQRVRLVQEFNPEGILGRTLSEAERRDFRQNPQEYMEEVKSNLSQRRKDVQKIIENNDNFGKMLGLTDEEAVVVKGLFEEADRTAALVRDPEVIRKQTTNIKKKVVRGVKDRQKAIKANDNHIRQIKSLRGRARITEEQKSVLNEALMILDEADSKWGSGTPNYDITEHLLRLERGQTDLVALADAKSPTTGKRVLTEPQRARVLKASSNLKKLADAENKVVTTTRNAYKKVPYQAIEQFDELLAVQLREHIFSVTKNDSKLGTELLDAVDEALEASKQYDFTQEMFDPAGMRATADDVAAISKEQAQAMYNAAISKIDEGLAAAKKRNDGLLGNRVNFVEEAAAATTVKEAFETGGNGSVGKQANLLQAGFVPRAIPAKHIALAKAVRLNQDPSLPPGTMSRFAEELDAKLAAAGEDFTVTNNGKGWTEAELAYFDWVNDTFQVDVLPSARVAYLDTPPNGFANEQVLLLASDGVRAVDPKVSLAMGTRGVFKGQDALDVAQFKRLKEAGEEIPDELQAKIDALDFGRAYQSTLSRVVELRNKGEVVPPELQKVYDNVVASLAADMRKNITEATVEGITSGYFSPEMAEGVITRIADYMPDVYMKIETKLMERLKMAFGDAAEAMAKRIKSRSSQSLNDYRMRGNHKKRAVNKHLSRAERKQKGLIDDARVLFIRGYNEILNDIANLKFFNSIRDSRMTSGQFKGQKIMMTAEEVEAAGLPQVTINWKGRNALTTAKAEIFDVVLGDWGNAKYVNLPDNPALGEFAGKYVPDEIFFEFKRLVDSPAATSLQFYSPVLQFFKWGKTAASPVTSARNHVSNWTVADMNGMLVGPGSTTARAVLKDTDLMSQVWNQKGDLYEEAMLSGVLGTDFVTSELAESFKFSPGDVPDFFSISDNPTILANVMTAWEMGRYNEVARLMGRAVKGAPKSLAKATVNAPSSVIKGAKAGVRFASHQYRFGDDFYKTWRYTQIRRLQDEFAKNQTLTREMVSALGGKDEALRVLNIDGQYAKQRAAARKVFDDGFVSYAGASLAVQWAAKSGFQPFALFTGQMTPVIRRLISRNAFKSLLYRNTTRQLEEYTMRMGAERNEYDYDEVEIARSTLPFGSNVNGFFTGQRDYTDVSGKKHQYFAFQNKGPLVPYGGTILPSDEIANEPTSELPLAGMFKPQFPILREILAAAFNRGKYDSNYMDLAPFNSQSDWLESASFVAKYYGQDVAPVIARDLYRAGVTLEEGKFVTPTGRQLFPEDLVEEIILLQKPMQATRKSFKQAQERAEMRAQNITIKDLLDAKLSAIEEGTLSKPRLRKKRREKIRKEVRAIKDEFRRLKREAKGRAGAIQRSAESKRLGTATERMRDRQEALEAAIQRINQGAQQ